MGSLCWVLLCTTDYPNWRKLHLDQDGSWKNPDKTAAKREVMGDDDNNNMHSLADTKPHSESSDGQVKWQKTRMYYG